MMDKFTTWTGRSIGPYGVFMCIGIPSRCPHLWLLRFATGGGKSQQQQKTTNFVTLPFPIPSEYDVRNTIRGIVRKNRDRAMGETKNGCPERTSTECCRHGEHTTHHATVDNRRSRADLNRRPHCSDDISQAIEVAGHGEREAITCYAGR